MQPSESVQPSAIEQPSESVQPSAAEQPSGASGGSLSGAGGISVDPDPDDATGLIISGGALEMAISALDSRVSALEMS